jgi:hypothetical protein
MIHFHSSCSHGHFGFKSEVSFFTIAFWYLTSSFGFCSGFCCSQLSSLALLVLLFLVSAGFSGCCCCRFRRLVQLRFLLPFSSPSFGGRSCSRCPSEHGSIRGFGWLLGSLVPLLLLAILFFRSSPAFSPPFSFTSCCVPSALFHGLARCFRLSSSSSLFPLAPGSC